MTRFLQKKTEKFELSIALLSELLVIRAALFTKKGQADWKQKYDAFLAKKCKMELINVFRLPKYRRPRELFSSVVFCPIIRSVPWFSAESVHRESDVL